MSQCQLELIQATLGESKTNLAKQIRKKHSMYVNIVEIGKQSEGNNHWMQAKLSEATTVHLEAMRELLLIGRKLHKNPIAWKKWLNHQCLMSENLANHYMNC